jgi:hypothetical protein
MHVCGRVDCLKPVTMGYQLSTEHMRKAGYTNIHDSEIQGMIMSVAMEEAVPSWRRQVYVLCRQRMLHI